MGRLDGVAAGAGGGPAVNPSPDEYAETLAEIRERINLVRSRLADNDAEERGEVGHAVEMWTAVYGLTSVTGRTTAELRANLARRYDRKLDAATFVINKLAWMLAEVEGLEPTEVLDRADRELTETFQRLGGGDPDAH